MYSLKPFFGISRPLVQEPGVKEGPTLKNTIRSLFVTVLLSGLVGSARLEAAQNLGMIGVKSVYGYYLQAHTDGEMHASNPHQNQEETWYLIEVDGPNHIYALLNFRNGMFMSKRAHTCVPANGTVLGQAEKWEMISGHPYGIENAVAFKSLADGTYLGTQDGGHDVSEGCGGEVNAVVTDLNSDEHWPGWWVISQTTDPPQPGSNVLSTLGNVLGGVFGQLGPADVVSFLASLF